MCRNTRRNHKFKNLRKRLIVNPRHILEESVLNVLHHCQKLFSQSQFMWPIVDGWKHCSKDQWRSLQCIRKQRFQPQRPAVVVGSERAGINVNIIHRQHFITKWSSTSPGNPSSFCSSSSSSSSPSTSSPCPSLRGALSHLLSSKKKGEPAGNQLLVTTPRQD